MDLSETEFPNVALGETPHRIDAKTLRDLAPGKLLDEWKRTNYEQLSAFLDRFGTAAKASDLGRLLLAGVERDNTRRYRTKRPRKTELDALQWQAVAEVYLDALERGEHPTLAVKEKFNISKSAAAKRVAKCRARGLLPPTSKGRSAGTRKEGTS